MSDNNDSSNKSFVVRTTAEEVAAFWDAVENVTTEQEQKTVVCKFCRKETDPYTAHLHQEEWVGDECCWDERLRSTE